MICDLLSIPDADTAAFSWYGAAIGSALSGIRSLSHAREVMAADAAIGSLLEELFEAAASRARRRPGQRAGGCRAAGTIRPGELLPLCSLLLVAGFETTVNLVGNAVNALLDHPDQWAALVADPGLAAAAVQETLRYDPPVQRTARVAFDGARWPGADRPRLLGNVLLAGPPRPGRLRRLATFDLARTDVGEHSLLQRHPPLRGPPARRDGGDRRPTAAGRAGAARLRAGPARCAGAPPR